MIITNSISRNTKKEKKKRNNNGINVQVHYIGY